MPHTPWAKRLACGSHAMAPTLTAVLQKKAVGKDGSGGYQKRYFCLCTSSIMYYERAPADGAFDHHPKARARLQCA